MADPDNSATMPEAPASDVRSKLEQRKLELEIAQLVRPFWQSTAFLSLVIAFAGIFIGFYTGFFDKQKVLLDITKANLERDVKHLDVEKRRVTGEIAQLKATFLGELTVAMERDVETFLLKDLEAVLHGNVWLYQEGHLSKDMFPDYFSLIRVPRSFLEGAEEYLGQVAWEPGYNLSDIQVARLQPKRQEDRTFHCWVSLRALLAGDLKWLEAHALECSSSYDRTKAAVMFEDLRRLREQHRKRFVEQYVRTFPPLQGRLAQLRAQYGENKASPSNSALQPTAADRR